jgi:hypothetical protein
MSKIITNPTDSEVSIVVEGTRFSVDSKSDVVVPEAVASIWSKTHGFLKVSEVKVKETKEEIKQEPKEEVKEEVEVKEVKEVKIKKTK